SFLDKKGLVSAKSPFPKRPSHSEQTLYSNSLQYLLICYNDTCLFWRYSDGFSPRRIIPVAPSKDLPPHLKHTRNSFRMKTIQIVIKTRNLELLCFDNDSQKTRGGEQLLLTRTATNRLLSWAKKSCACLRPRAAEAPVLKSNASMTTKILVKSAIHPYTV